MLSAFTLFCPVSMQSETSFNLGTYVSQRNYIANGITTTDTQRGFYDSARSDAQVFYHGKFMTALRIE